MGITLIALIITIILLLILAGVTIHFTLGENGILKNASIARNKYKNAEENEINLLNEINRAVTNRGGISEETIRKIVQEEIKNNYTPPTGLKTDIYISENMTRTDAYQDVTSMAGFDSVVKDSANKIDEYIEFSNAEGYKIKKSGWYFIRMSIQVNGTSSATGTINFYYNENQVQWLVQCANGGIRHQNDSFPIYLNSGDSVYFVAGTSNKVSTQRIITATIFPMF